MSQGEVLQHSWNRHLHHHWLLGIHHPHQNHFRLGYRVPLRPPQRQGFVQVTLKGFHHFHYQRHPHPQWTTKQKQGHLDQCQLQDRWHHNHFHFEQDRPKQSQRSPKRCSMLHPLWAVQLKRNEHVKKKSLWFPHVSPTKWGSSKNLHPRCTYPRLSNLTRVKSLVGDGST